MAKTATIHVRIDDNTKQAAVAVLDTLGISIAEAVTLYFKQVALRKGIPFELTIPEQVGRNFDRVSEFKRDDLQKVLDVVPDSVDELWVFGSAITKYCRPESDLDVCVVGNSISKADRKIMAHAPRRGMDLIDVTHAEFEEQSLDKNSIFNSVKEKGLLIYRKGVGLVDG